VAANTADPESSPSPRSPAEGVPLYPLAVFLFTLLIYWATAIWVGRTATPAMAYYNHLADAFAHGRLYLEDPPDTFDLTPHQGRWYVPFPPLPALVMLPWVALAGVENTSVMVFSLAAGAGTVGLLWLILEALAARGWSRLRPRDNLWLCAMLAIGSVHWSISIAGTVWYLAQVFAVLFLALAIWLAVRRSSPWPAATALGIAMWGRPHLLLAWPLLAGIAAESLRAADGRLDRNRWTAWCFCSAVPLVLSVAGLLAYNHARFGHPLDFGYSRQNVSLVVYGDLHTYGQFHYRYIPRNLHAMLLALPVWDERTGRLVPDEHGMSILLTSPALILLWRARQPRPLVRGAWLAIGLILIPLLTYYNTGWVQFGYRFSLDFLLPALVLMAAAAGPRLPLLIRFLIAAGALVNAWGTDWVYTKWFYELTESLESA
jgi:hypothetical protein